MIKNDIKLTFRNLLRNKVYAFINIGGLALGMATAALLMLWVQNEWRFDSYHKNADNIYRIKTHLKINDKDIWHWATTPWQLGDHLKETAPEVQEVTRLFPPIGVDVSLKINNDVFSEDKLAFVDKNWFDVFNYTFIKGNAKDFINDKNSIAITESRAKKFFGDTDPIDKIIQYDSMNLVVKAVLKDLPTNTSFQYEILGQNAARQSNPENFRNDMEWGNFNYETYLVCNNGVNMVSVSDKFTKSLRQFRSDTSQKTVLELQPLKSIHFDNSLTTFDVEITTGDKTILSIFTLIAFFILLIACINYVNLTTARATRRTKEVSIKKIIGASKRGLFQQFFGESIIMSLLAAALAAFLITLGLPLLSKITDLPFSLAENPAIWGALGGITVLSVILTGIYPSLFLSSFQPIKILRGGSFGGVSNAILRKGLVVFQFTFTIVLLISTFLIFKQLRYIQTKQLGYEKEHILTFTMPWFIKDVKQKQDIIFQKLKNESSILDATLSNSDILLVKNTHSGSLNWSGKDPNWQPTATLLSMTPNYPDFYKLKLVEGRWLKTENKADENNFVLNETAVREYGIPKPVVGQPFEMHGRKGQIVGIAKDFHFKNFKEKIAPMVLFINQGWLGTVSVKTAPNQTLKAIQTIERIWKENVPDFALKYAFLDETYDKMHRKEQNQLALFNAFASIVLLISCFGLFGLATFAAETRIKEIGIRKVLGASVISITHLLSKDFLKLILLAFVISTPIAWYLGNKWLENYAYRIQINGWIFAFAGIVTLLIALLTVSFQAIKAAIANPVKSLRTE